MNAAPPSLTSWPAWARQTLDRLLLGKPQPLDRLWADPGRLMRWVGLTPDPWQMDVLTAPADRLLLLCARQAGKALHTDTPIATPNGWSTMGNLRVGDRVFDEAGTPCSVTSCSEVQDRPVFRVRFSDGSEIVADGEHLWTTL